MNIVCIYSHEGNKACNYWETDMKMSVFYHCCAAHRCFSFLRDGKACFSAGKVMFPPGSSLLIYDYPFVEDINWVIWIFYEICGLPNLIKPPFQLYFLNLVLLQAELLHSWSFIPFLFFASADSFHCCRPEVRNSLTDWEAGYTLDGSHG